MLHQKCLEAESALLTDVLFDLVTYGYSSPGGSGQRHRLRCPATSSCKDSQEYLSLPMKAVGAAICWTASRDFQVNGISVKRAVSTSFYHVHQWSSQWYNDQDYHWHECEADYCLITDNSCVDAGAHVYDCQWFPDAYLATEADCTPPPPTTIPCVRQKAGLKPLSMATAPDTAGQRTHV